MPDFWSLMNPQDIQGSHAKRRDQRLNSLTYGQGDIQGMINQLYRSLATQTAAGQNKAQNTAIRTGASGDAQLASNEAIAYNANIAGQTGLQAINDKVQGSRIDAMKFLMQLDQREAFAQSEVDSQRRGDLLGAVATIGGGIAGGPIGAAIGKGVSSIFGKIFKKG